MRGRRRGKKDPRQLGVDERALRLLTARLPQGDQSDLQEVRVVLVHVCDGPQTDDLNGLVLPATRILVRARTFKFLRRPRIDSQEPIPPGCVVWRAGTTTLFLLGS
jgi:hypothetical protein